MTDDVPSLCGIPAEMVRRVRAMDLCVTSMMDHGDRVAGVANKGFGGALGRNDKVAESCESAMSKTGPFARVVA